nr:hypothetical protein [uncultured Methanolobus sp.]
MPSSDPKKWISYELNKKKIKKERKINLLHLVEVLIIISGFLMANLSDLPKNNINIFFGSIILAFLIWSVIIHSFSIMTDDEKYLTGAYWWTAFLFPLMLVMFFVLNGFINTDFSTNIYLALLNILSSAFLVSVLALVLVLVFDEKFTEGLIEFVKDSYEKYQQFKQCNSCKLFVIVAYIVLIDITACLQSFLGVKILIYVPILLFCIKIILGNTKQESSKHYFLRKMILIFIYFVLILLILLGIS